MQAWESDKLKEDWEPDSAVDAGQGGSRTVYLRGAEGIVTQMVASILPDLMKPLSGCSAADCFDLSDDAELEVRSRLHF